MSEPKKESGQEKIKRESAYLRGNLAAELADANDYVSDDSYELLKFYGSYQGYDRDTATERKKAGLDKEWEFMLRMKLPGGRMTAERYLALDALCDERANGSLRVTTRQTFQFHQIVKQDLAPFVAEINRLLLSTLGGCGDVVRNVITCPAPIKDNVHAVLEDAAYRLAKHMAPKTEAYYDIFLDGEKIEGYPFAPEPYLPLTRSRDALASLSPSGGEGRGEGVAAPVEPMYGPTYLPRKFKIAIGQPEDNCMDALCNDIALLALFDGQELQGYNLALGGGLGMKHNNPKTYPRLASPVAFVKPEDMLRAAEAVVKLQRDHGDRTDRQHARLKYVVEEKGAAWVKSALESYFCGRLDTPKPVKRWAVEDHMGWHAQGDGKWFLGVPVPSGRIADYSPHLTSPRKRGEEEAPSPACGGGLGRGNAEGAFYRTALREVISAYKMPVILTNDQNIILADIEDGEKEAVTGMLRKHGVRLHEDITPLERNFLACVALPTCGKALAEAERVQDPLVKALDKLAAKHGLSGDKLTIRLAGCPNGCSRPYVGDISLVGRMPGHYVIYVGGDFEGTRMGEAVFDKVPLEQVPAALDPMLAKYAKERKNSEGFGDWCARAGIAAVKQAAVDALGGTYKWAA